ncbi:hypothetical protein SAY87_024535 [Trapa incisa]|uniref:Uncharacterized protein n=1 Tax=Trapa incisa TaxID=236973 RepID=A0AAN7JFH3_9MYRT|nr:hypothetical protein SAY87_024535 [Trapa incisa]
MPLMRMLRFLPGDRIWFGSETDKETLPSVFTPNQLKDDRFHLMHGQLRSYLFRAYHDGYTVDSLPLCEWTVQPHLKIDASCNALLLGEHGLVTSSSLKNANRS